MFDWLQPQRDMADCGLGSPVRHLERYRLLSDRLLAVHVNHLGPGDARLLGERRVSVAHCPRTHAYFGRGPFPFHELQDAGVNLCFGTDSLASVAATRTQPVELDLFTEMQTFAKAAPGVPPASILQMATVNAARALGWAGQFGQISPDASADLIAIPFTGAMGSVHERAMQHAGPVAGSMIAGRWAVPPASQ